MTPEFKYRVVYANDDGDKSGSRFLKAGSAYVWARRLADEGFESKIFKKTADGGEIELSLSELKKEAGPLQTTRRKPVKLYKQQHTVK